MGEMNYIVRTDSFMSMPLSAQALYFHLCERADEDDYIPNPEAIKRMVGATDGDMAILVNDGYLAIATIGVIVIKSEKLRQAIFIEE